MISSLTLPPHQKQEEVQQKGKKNYKFADTYIMKRDEFLFNISYEAYDDLIQNIDKRFSGQNESVTKIKMTSVVLEPRVEEGIISPTTVCKGLLTAFIILMQDSHLFTFSLCMVEVDPRALVQ